ncbi:hypothetical protein CEXT_464171 [Caerostris extrusa]|uniref:Uncharacterized protein n=1 Tax=Caerostris extrusa TaxID=172846 RepID=A0AAV4R6J8_CAEEX|nr:hypothetical protein CEXT_464171 [Caerostris extrusa]
MILVPSACLRIPTSRKEEERKALNVSKSEMEKQVTGYFFQGGNSKNGSSQSQMDCEEYPAKLKNSPPPGPCRWLLDLSAKYAEDRPLTVDETVSLIENDKMRNSFLHSKVTPPKKTENFKTRFLKFLLSIPSLHLIKPQTYRLMTHRPLKTECIFSHGQH